MIGKLISDVLGWIGAVMIVGAALAFLRMLFS